MCNSVIFYIDSTGQSSSYNRHKVTYNEYPKRAVDGFQKELAIYENMGIRLCDYFTKAVLVTSPLYNAHIGWCMNNVCSPKSLHVLWCT